MIKWLVFGQSLLLLLVIGLVIAAVIYRLRTSKASDTAKFLATLHHEALICESKGDWDQLLTKAEEIVSEFPSDLMGHWYCAIANLRLQHAGAALSAFSRIQQIDSTWMSDDVEAYIAEIRSGMQGPKTL